MHNCLSELCLSEFIDGALPEPESEEVRRHLSRCADCAAALKQLLVLQDMEAEGLLKPPDKRQAEKIRASIRKALQSSKLPSAPRVRSRLTEKMKDLFGTGLAAGASLAQNIGQGISGHSPLPTFGHGEKKNLENFVRFGPQGATSHYEDQVHNPSHENDAMIAAPHSHEIHHAPTAFGLPDVSGQSPDVKQAYADTCAIRSQELVLRSYGIHISEADLRKEATAHGLYSEGSGTTMDHVGDLLEMKGVHVHRYTDANIFNLTNELAQGHKVIIGVNSGELWHHGILHDYLHAHGLNGADHALIVSGIDTSDPDHIRVNLTDPGTGDIAKSYPFDQFLHAWKDSHCFMVATTKPAPPWLPEMEHFNYDLGHIESIGHLPFERFESEFAHADPTKTHLGFGIGEILFEVFLHLVTEGVAHFNHPAPDVADPSSPDSTSDHQHHHEPSVEELLHDHQHPQPGQSDFDGTDHHHDPHHGAHDQNPIHEPWDDHHGSEHYSEDHDSSLDDGDLS